MPFTAVHFSLGLAKNGVPRDTGSATLRAGFLRGWRRHGDPEDERRCPPAGDRRCDLAAQPSRRLVEVSQNLGRLNEFGGQGPDGHQKPPQMRRRFYVQHLECAKNVIAPLVGEHIAERLGNLAA